MATAIYRDLIRCLIKDAEDNNVTFTDDFIERVTSPKSNSDDITSLYEAFTSSVIEGKDPSGFVIGALTPSAVYFIRQITGLQRKLRSDKLPDDNVIQNFINLQGDLRKQTARNVPSSILDLASTMCSSFLNKCDFSHIVMKMKHGPGAVAEKLTRDVKWEFPSWPLSLDRLFPYDLYVGSDGGRICEKANSRLIRVPKDARKTRLIAAEPNAYQYVQQGILSVLASTIQRSSFRRVVMLDRQTNNSDILLKHSFNDYATIDLSEASDRVSFQLVKSLFGPSRNWKYLARCRTSSTSVGNKTYRLTTFATMGSAMCFPIESIVFASLAIATCRFILGRDYSEKLIRVYGDDIIVPNSCADLLCQVLLSLNMIPNARKTCIKGKFRESCGCEVFADHDVTISYNKVIDWEHPVLRHYGSAISIENNFSRHGADRAAGLIRSLYPRVPCAPGFFTGTLDLRASITRWNSDYQRREIRLPVKASKPIQWRLPEARLTARLHGDYSETERLERDTFRDKWIPLFCSGALL